MSDFSIPRLGPISRSGDGSIQRSQQETSRHRRQRPYPEEADPVEDAETSEEDKHDLDRLA